MLNSFQSEQQPESTREVVGQDSTQNNVKSGTNRLDDPTSTAAAVALVAVGTLALLKSWFDTSKIGTKTDKA